MARVRNGESFPKKEKEDQETPAQPVVGSRKRASKRATSSGVEDDDDIKPPELSKSPPRAQVNKRARAAKREVTLEDTDAFDCSICFLPLKPPIFQCEVGHVVCLSCRNKIKNPLKCHVCGGGTGGFRRCHAMERVVESVHISCPNSSSGCTAKPAYHEQQAHQKTCTMLSRFHCPGDQCSFVGSMDALLSHFAGVHGWPCTTRLRQGKYESCKVVLRNGFNFLRTNIPSATATTTTQILFLLNLVRQPDGAAAISLLCIQSHGASAHLGPSLKEVICDLRYHLFDNNRGRRLIQFWQSAKVRVACTDFSKGLPNTDDCFKFVVPNDAHGDEATVELDFLFSVDS